jgi:PAS domain-containing protein
MDSQFAPARRSDPEDVAWLARDTVENPIFQAVLASVAGYVMVLDEHRQVLAANGQLLQALGLPSDGAIIGLRPGEALGCDQVQDGPGGCGTAQACSQCGAVLATLAAQAGLEPVDGECRLAFHRFGQAQAAEFRVRATPLVLGGHHLTILVLLDLSASPAQVPGP